MKEICRYLENRRKKLLVENWTLSASVENSNSYYDLDIS